MPKARARWVRGTFAPACFLSLCGLVAICLSLWSIRQELIVQAYQAPPDGHASPAVGSEMPAYAPARAYLALALSTAQKAADTQNVFERKLLLAQARRNLASIANVRPHWAEYWIAKAYIESLASPSFSPQEKSSLIQSYLDAPYLHSAGPWRVTRAMAHWSAFPRFAQDRITKETVWLVHTSSVPVQEQILAAARASDAYVPVFMEMRRNPD